LELIHEERPDIGGFFDDFAYWFPCPVSGFGFNSEECRIRPCAFFLERRSELERMGWNDPVVVVRSRNQDGRVIDARFHVV